MKDNNELPNMQETKSISRDDVIKASVKAADELQGILEKHPELLLLLSLFQANIIHILFDEEKKGD